MQDRMVKVLDPETKKIITIPLRELVPGMMRSHVVGEGEVFVHPSQVTLDGTIRHASLSPELLEKVRVIQEAFAEVRPISVEEWDEGFRKDMHPDQEIAVFLHAAAVFRQFTKHLGSGDIEKKQAVYEVIGVCLRSGKDLALLTPPPLVLTKKRVKEIVEYFFSNWKGKEVTAGTDHPTFDFSQLDNDFYKDVPLDEQTVQFFVDEIKKGQPILPPVLMKRKNNTSLVVDGLKRLEAKRRCGQTSTDAYVVEERSLEEFLELRKALNELDLKDYKPEQ